MGISAIVPVFDEEAAIGEVVAGVVGVLPRLARDWEVILIDDGSRDATGRLADALSEEDPRIRVVHHDENRGYGVAIRSGLGAARHPFVFWIDGDGQFDASDLVLLRDALGHADFVTGFRAKRADHVGRRLNSWLWNQLVRAMFGVRVMDVNCAFKLFRRDLLEGAELDAVGSMISSEVLLTALQRGASVAERFVPHYPRTMGRATGADTSVILRALVDAFRIRRRMHRSASP